MQIKIFNKGNGWVGGTCEDYSFEAKVFDSVGAGYGINKGRVDKLSIWNEDDRQYSDSFYDACLVSYNRGWDKKPKGEMLDYYANIMEVLENYNKVEW